MADIIASVDKKDVFAVSDTSYFKNFKFPSKKISDTGEVIDSTKLPQIKDTYKSSREEPIPDNDSTINVKNITTYHYLEAQKPKNSSIELTMVAPSKSKKPNDCVVEAINDNNKIYTPFSGTAKQFNTVVPIANTAANVITWLEAIADIFSSETGTFDKLERAGKETLYYIPYVGQLLSIGENVLIGDFKNALLNTGLIILLDIAPELNIPLLGAFEAYKEYKSLEEFRKAIDNVIDERNKRWHSVYSFVAHQWYGQVNIQIEQRLNHFYQALSYQAGVIKNRVDIEYARHKEGLEEKEERKLMWASVDCIGSIEASVKEATKNAEKFLEKSSILYFKEEILPKVHKNLEEFDKNTLFNIYTNIDEFSNRGIAEISECKKVEADVNNGFRPIKFDFSLLTNLMKSDSLTDEVILEKALEDALVFSLGVRNGKIQNLSKKWANLTIGTDIRVVHGRDNESIRLNSTQDSSIQIEKNTNLRFLDSENFSLSFWIRVPRYNKFDKDKDLNNEYTIVNNMDTATKGFKISIKNGILLWTLKGTQQKTIEIPLSNTKVSDNIWRHVAIINNKDGNCTIYVDGAQKNAVSLSGLDEITNTLPITLQLVGNKNKKQFIRLDQFNIYEKALSQTEVGKLFSSYFKDSDIRDYWGEPLAYNKTYNMINIAYQGRGLQSTNNKISLQPKAVFDPTGDGSYIPRLYRGYDVLLQKDSQSKTTDIMPKKDDLINIKLKSGHNFVGFNSTIDTSQKYLKLTTALLSEVDDPKGFKLMSLKKDNWIQIKKETWMSKNGNVIPQGLVGKRSVDSDVYLYLWDWETEKDDYSEKQWSFICQDEGWIDSDGMFTNA
ncbi:botulinum/tetanus neurotoxin translocation domain-containing protein (plasmid) [Paraclostridium ghonii]|uniref:botulinum/tetanus neurotoxin translocation domain-containing protein n=1 Tax=Paraclostridium ghonii TaxID=29358 RepID=UPI00202CA74C|nr:botulinum/tetanus neurotoxin translocation domain-containing protein [Paeniclostridium ghonii]MCM0165537.1 hypothetical protein [Paeniclostridium ghonii]